MRIPCHQIIMVRPLGSDRGTCHYDDMITIGGSSVASLQTFPARVRRRCPMLLRLIKRPAPMAATRLPPVLGNAGPRLLLSPDHAIYFCFSRPRRSLLHLAHKRCVCAQVAMLGKMERFTLPVGLYQGTIGSGSPAGIDAGRELSSRPCTGISSLKSYSNNRRKTRIRCGDDSPLARPL